VDAYSNGFHVPIVEECTCDRSELIHKVNLFDLHHKYVDVMHRDEVESHLERLTANELSTIQAALAEPKKRALPLADNKIAEKVAGSAAISSGAVAHSISLPD
jgi:hypothetical protein